jgi:5-methylcytosine-specific restriction endonuclease McrA
MKRVGFDYKKRQKILAKTGGKCFYCGTELHYQEVLDWGGKAVQSIALWDVDHVIPVSKGGGNEMDNLVPSCRSCNNKKGAK